MASPSDNVFGAFGSVVGYVGAEAATTVAFERLLWPQRHYSNFHLSSGLGVAALTGMGGPVHKAALAILDNFLEHGLFRGRNQGHMLGTAFFRGRPEWTWHQVEGHNGVAGKETVAKPIRNCFWPRAMSLVPAPVLSKDESGRPRTPASPSCMEKAALQQQQQVSRARVCVNHIVITPATTTDKNSNQIPFVSEDSGIPSLRVFLGIVASELSGIVVASVIVGWYMSPWAVLFVLPLAIRLFAAVLSLHRQKLVPVDPSTLENKGLSHFEVHYPQAGGDFMVITGSPSLVQQFFRHYGHPLRDRPREVAQLASVVFLGLLFPAGLLSSVLWMPAYLQYFWMSYQLYLVLAMHVARYWEVIESCTTLEAKIARALERNKDEDTMDCKRAAILFGHSRHGRETIRVDVSITYHGRHQEGKDQTAGLLARPPQDYIAQMDRPLSGTSSTA